jgi:pterin-4a-carbinolamine dehydratase
MTSFYFLDESIRGKSKDKNMLRESSDFPVRIRKNTWEHLEEPRRISKTFSFSNLAQQLYFISEVLSASEARDHEIKMLIEGRDVTIETYTHTLEDVTELDLKIARDCDQIFRDARFVAEIE